MFLRIKDDHISSFINIKFINLGSCLLTRSNNGVLMGSSNAITFDAQTIQVDMSHYKLTAIQFIDAPTLIYPYDSSFNAYSIPGAENDSFYLAIRHITVNSSGITFGTAHYVYRDGGNGDSSGLLVPCKIGGIK